MSTKYINFSVSGEFVTKLAREKLEIQKDLASALELLVGMLNTNQISPDEIAGNALRILTGQAEIVGTYPNDDYGYKVTDASPIDFSKLNVAHGLEQKVDELEREVNDLQEKLCFIETNYSSYYRLSDVADAYYEETGKTLFGPDSLYSVNLGQNKIIDSIIKATKYDNNYGWLDPMGNFYPVPWGEHTEWAQRYIVENYEITPLDDDYMTPADTLANKGWVLLHNPSKGLPLITNIGHGLTKQQRDFLYGFFIDRNMQKEADAVMSESDD